MLSETVAIEIFNAKLDFLHQLEFRHCQHVSLLRGKSTPLAKMYGISSRAVRDIWNRHTWGHATKCLWPVEDALLRDSKLNHEILGKFITVCDLNHKFHLYSSCLKSDLMQKVYRHPGRPKGCKDSKPRKQSSTLSENKSNAAVSHVSGIPLHPSGYCSNVEANKLASVDPFHEDWPYWETSQPEVPL